MSKKYEKWSFDKEYLKDLIANGEKAIKEGTVADEDVPYIKADIITYKKFIRGVFSMSETVGENVDDLDTIEKLKENILNKMSLQYNTLGSDFIKWIIRLKEDEVFKDIGYSNSITKISIDEMVELTLKNYEIHSPKFYMPAKEIVLNNKNRRIQLISSGGSYCHHDTLTDGSFLLINPNDPALILNHELQHAIEYQFDYAPHEYYYELGPIYFELLFNDLLYNQNGFLKRGDFAYRLEDSCASLDELYYYFKVVLLFAQKNFDLSTKEFVKIFIRNDEMPESVLKEFLKEEIEDGLMVEDMNYVFSFLKAIELREMTLSKNRPITEEVESYINCSDFNFPLPQDGFMPYKRYIEETQSRVRRKK